MNNPKPSSPKNQPKEYAKYLSMATYMGVIITLGVMGGQWLDEKLPPVKTPVYTIILALLSVFASIWYFIRDFIRKK